MPETWEGAATRDGREEGKAHPALDPEESWRDMDRGREPVPCFPLPASSGAWLFRALRIESFRG